MILGSMLLFESVDPIMRVSHSLIYAFSITTGAITLFLVSAVIRSLRSKVKSGQEGMIGQVAETMKPMDPKRKGKVFVHGELWNAKSTDTIKKGEEVKVTEGVNTHASVFCSNTGRVEDTLPEDPVTATLMGATPFWSLNFIRRAVAM